MEQSKCIFCEIIKGIIPCKKKFENEYILAFNDIQPVASQHILFIPKLHIPSLDDLQEKDSFLIGEIFYRISEYAQKEGFSKNGYRVVHNVGEDGLQTVHHIHFHLIAGRKFLWPPG